MNTNLMLCFLSCFTGMAFGADVVFTPKADSDRTAEVRNAVKDGATLRFAKGEYHFRSPSGLGYYISNHNNPQPHPVFLPITNVTDVCLLGDGAVFIFHGAGIGLTLMDTRRVSVKGIAFDWANPTFTEARVERFDGANAVLRIDTAQFPTVIEKGKLTSVGERRHYVPRLAHFFDGATQIPFASSGFNPVADDLGGGFFRVREDWTKGRGGRAPKPGDIVLLRDGFRPNPGVSLYRAHDTLFEACSIHVGDGMGFVAQRSENVTLIRCGAFPRSGTGRSLSLQADATHFSNCKGQIRVEACRFEGMADDAINVHSTSLRIERVPAPDRLVCRYMHSQSTGFEVFLPGERLRFLRASTMEPGAETTVREAVMPDPLHVELRLADPVPAGYAPGDAVENAAWQPDVTFRSNTVCNARCRGALFTTPGRVVCEDNLFDHTSGLGLLFEGDASGWFESGASRSVSIRNNVFRDCCILTGEAVIKIAPRVRNLSAQKERYHRNIVIENNRFETFPLPLLRAQSVSNLIWRANEVALNADYPARGKGRFAIDRCEAVETLSILVLGHSFGMDSTEHLPALLNAAGIGSVRIGRFSKANCSLKERWEFIETGAKRSRDGKENGYYECAPGSTVWVRRDRTEKEVLAERPWDYVVLQDSLDNEGRYAETKPWLEKVASFIREDAKRRFGREPELCWNLFWPMSRLCENTKNKTLAARMAHYANRSETMWAAYAAAARELAADTGITNIVPTGATVMRLRASPLNTPDAREFTCDGYHLSRGAGRYAAACAFFAHFITPLYGKDVVGNPLRLLKFPAPVTDANARLIQACAQEAERAPFGTQE